MKDRTGTEDATQAVVLLERVKLEESGGIVAIVTLNRPKKHNCFNRDVVESLSRIFGDLANEVENDEKKNGRGDGEDDDPLVAVIFTGSGRSFCAGADLSNPPDPLAASSDLLDCLRNNPIHQMSRVGVPIIGAVKGYVSIVPCN
jgi:enoyl-CoA hydratase/carnithine racemase